MGREKGRSPHSNGSDLTADGFFGPSFAARSRLVPANAPAKMKATAMPMYSLIVSPEDRSLHHEIHESHESFSVCRVFRASSNVVNHDIHEPRSISCISCISWFKHPCN